MDVAAVYLEAYSRIIQVVERVLTDLQPAALTWQPEPGSNSIAWLVWHLTRVQDDHVSELAGTQQQWVVGAFATRFGLDASTVETGYGHSPQQVKAVQPESVDVVAEYHRRVIDTSIEFLATVSPADLDRVIDTSYEPPVTVGVRLVSVLSDNLQHAGQAAYLRGLYDRSNSAG